ncbi:hypothetical protein [Methanosarcina sp. KYL-1]|nr:hypothetical protein [Methanosarcina sp. KYL-1]
MSVVTDRFKQLRENLKNGEDVVARPDGSLGSAEEGDRGIRVPEGKLA